MSSRLEEFRAQRERMNKKILESEHVGIKRFFRLDTAAYEDGPLPGKIKELLGLVALVVGGSIVIPHLRHAFETLELLRQEEA
jgi:hypothetical protein